MELQDRFMEWLLVRLDRMLDMVTFCLWSTYQGNKTWRSYTTIENLKLGWKKDPCWDIEKTEGFEEYRDELLAWRKEYEAENETKQLKRDAARAVLVREQTGVMDGDIVLALSTWSEIERMVSSQDEYLGMFEKREAIANIEIMQAQIRATLLLAAQVKRVADELKEMRLHGLIVGQA